MAQSTTDRNVLFGIVSMCLDFITRNELITAMKSWVTEKDKSLGQVLQSQGALAEGDDALMASLVNRLMERYDNDAGLSLSALTAVGAIREDLERIGDHELNHSVGMLGSLAETTPAGPSDANPHAYGAAGSEGCRFRPIEFHARGGQGEVWIARDTELNREVALKRLRDDHADNPWSRVRFVHEAEVTGALEHRGIAPVYGRGYFEDGRPYYAMRFIGGTSLKKAIETFHAQDPSTQGTDERSLELRRLLGRFVDACNTVAYAHSRGVIHRDLKPDNIILDEYGETLVVDWGLAKSGCGGGESLPGEDALRPVSASALPSTETGDIMGTLYFMSPEQAGGGSSEVVLRPTSTASGPHSIAC